MGTFKQWGLDVAEVTDACRLFPRFLLVGYGWLLVDGHMWFKALENPSTAQQVYMNVLWGAAGLITGWYMNTGRKWSP